MMGDTKDESVKVLTMECNLNNKRKIVDENEVVPFKRKLMDGLVEPEPFSLNYLPDQILLDIFRNLTPMQLKAVAFTCRRMHRLIRDYTLWSDVDATDTKTGTKRLRWFLDNCLSENTVSLKLRGFAKELKGCLGIVDATKSVTNKDDDNIIYTNLVTVDDRADSSEDELVSGEDDDDEPEDSAKNAEDSAKNAEDSAKNGEDSAKNAEDSAKNAEDNAKDSEDHAKDDAKAADVKEFPETLNDEVRDPVKMIAKDRPKVVKMLREEYLSKGPGLPDKSAEAPVKQKSCGKRDPCPSKMPRQCSCTAMACPARMSKKKPWPKAVLDRMEELLTIRQFEQRTSCNKPTFTLTKKLLNQLVILCPNLTELDLDYCNIDCKTTSLAHFPSTLVKLSLCGTRMYNVPKPKTMLYHIHERLPWLEHLNVSKCEWLTPDTWLSMSKLPHLRYLIATDCPCMKDFIAYASLATKYGFPVLEYVDFRGSPLSDSEVSALGWVPTLRELYLSPPLDNYDDNFNLHTHFRDDPLSKVDELEAWEKEDYMKPNSGRRTGKKLKKRRSEGSGNLPLKKRKVDGGDEPRAFIQPAPTCLKVANSPADSSPKVSLPKATPRTMVFPTYDEFKDGSFKFGAPKVYLNPQPGSSKDGERPSTSKTNSEPLPGSSKDDVAPSPFKAIFEPQPGSSKDIAAPSTSKSNPAFLGGDSKGPKASAPKDTPKTIVFPTYEEFQTGSFKFGVIATPKACLDPQPGSSKDYEVPSTSKSNSEPLPGSFKDDVAPSTFKANPEPQPGSSKDVTPPAYLGSNCVSGISSFIDITEDSIEEVFPVARNIRGVPPNAPFRQNSPDEHRIDRTTGNLMGVKQILICQGGSIYQYSYDRSHANVGMNHLPTGYVIVPDPEPRGGSTVQPPSNMRRVRMVANLGNHLQLIDRQFNRQLELFRCTSLVTDVSVRYFGRSVGDEFVHIGPRRNNAPQNVPRETRRDVSNLRVLVVSGYPGITDVSLKHLSSAAPYLTFLDVRDTKVTEEGVNRFLALRPEVEILYGHFDDRGGHRLPGSLVT